MCKCVRSIWYLINIKSDPEGRAGPSKEREIGRAPKKRRAQKLHERAKAPMSNTFVPHRAGPSKEREIGSAPRRAQKLHERAKAPMSNTSAYVYSIKKRMQF